MRNHIAKHILLMNNGPNAMTCGYCGIIGGCTISKTITTESNCVHRYKFSLKNAHNSTKSKPSTNRPVDYLLCRTQTMLRSYNMEKHYQQSHPGITCTFLVDNKKKKDILK